MTTVQMILLAFALIFGIWLLMRVVSTIFRIVFILILVAALYYFFTGKSLTENINPDVKSFFKNKNINQLLADNCGTDDTEKSITCECVVMPMYDDMLDRLGKAEIKNLENSQVRMDAEMLKSFYNQSTNIKTCLNRKKEEKLSFISKIINFFSGK